MAKGKKVAFFVGGVVGTLLAYKWINANVAGNRLPALV